MAFDARVISETECQALVAASKDFCAVAGGLIRCLRSAPMTGTKWKEDGSRQRRVSEASLPYAGLEGPSQGMPLEIPRDQFGLPRAEVRE